MAGNNSPDLAPRSVEVPTDRLPVTILVCTSCRFPGQGDVWPRPGSDLAQSTRAAAAEQGIAFRKVACLGNCKRGLSAAVLRDGCWSYVFGELDTGSAADLIAGAKLLAQSSDGFMPFRARPDALKRGLVARVPTLANLEDLPS